MSGDLQGPWILSSTQQCLRKNTSDTFNHCCNFLTPSSAHPSLILSHILCRQQEAEEEKEEDEEQEEEEEQEEDV
jgi:hypothetical protein